ncbi:hypothetical protein, partial [Klebsiella pneumoniae]|uniref:hypothetical protein n=1 Tax=Klebsiella pneumoniae TaxID=573 RepID=UPI003B59D6DE
IAGGYIRLLALAQTLIIERVRRSILFLFNFRLMRGNIPVLVLLFAFGLCLLPLLLFVELARLRIFALFFALSLRFSAGVLRRLLRCLRLLLVPIVNIAK